jgi:heptosyltransferase I
MGSFCEPLGLTQTEVRWDIPIAEQDHAWAAEQLPGEQPTLLVSPTSSHVLRNWQAQRYAAVMDYAAVRGWRVVLIGGPSALERSMADAVLAACCHPPLDLTGKDTLKKLMAMFCRTQLLLTPDSGPMHMANTVGMKVLGLHAASNPARSGPYSDRRWCVDKYDAASRKYFGKPASEIPWGSKIERPGVMDLIEVDDVIERFDAAVAALGIQAR